MWTFVDFLFDIVFVILNIFWSLIVGQKRHQGLGNRYFPGYYLFIDKIVEKNIFFSLFINKSLDRKKM